MAGFVTSVIIRVGSVTSTCLRSSPGDMRNRSGPMLPLSSGALAGQTSTTRGSAALTDQATAHETNNAMAEATGCMAKILRSQVVKESWICFWATNRERILAKRIGQQRRAAFPITG